MLRLGWVLVLSAGAQLPDLPQINLADFLPTIRTQIERCEAEARAHPRDAKAAGALAMTLHAYQRYEAAAAVYARAHALEPENYDWVYLLGAVQTMQGEFDAAAGSFQSALRLRPNDLAAAVRLAQSLAATARWDEAGALYRRILDAHPDCAQAWYGLGRAQAAKGDHAAAVQSLAHACDLFPSYGAAHFALAGELRRLGKKTEAEQHLAAYSQNVTAEPPVQDPLFQRIRELNQGAQAHTRRAMELEKAGKLEDAIREQEQALAVEPANVQAHINLISLYGRTGDRIQAKQQFDEAVRLAPGRSDAWYNYGVLLFGERNYDEAEEAFRRALLLNPGYAEARTNLGAIYELKGQLGAAAGEFRAAIAAQPNYPPARFHLGRILVNEQKYPEAIQQFLRALSPEDENTTVYLYALAATYARAGDRGRALEYFQKARDAAVARGQVQVLSSIDRDMRTLSAGQ